MQAIGIDLGGTKIAAARVSAVGDILAEQEIPVPNTGSETEAAIMELCSQLYTDEVRGVGLGLAGLVSNPGGQFRWGPNVALRECDFGALITAKYDVSVVVDNDANVAAFGEAKVGAAEGAAHVLMVTVGTGIGGGIIVDGKLYRGASFAGEVGHLTVDRNGPPCTCGRRGCWEALASGRVLSARARNIAFEQPGGVIAKRAEGRLADGRDLVWAAEQGDPQANQVIAELAGWLALGIHSLLCVLDPEVIVVGGGVSALGEPILGPIKAAVSEAYGAQFRERRPEVRMATLGNQAGVVGAALLSLES